MMLRGLGDASAAAVLPAESRHVSRGCEEVPMAVVAGLLCFYTCMQVATYYGRVVEMWIHSSGTKSFSRFSLLGE